jgi:hypothetical protein
MRKFQFDGLKLRLRLVSTGSNSAAANFTPGIEATEDAIQASYLRIHGDPPTVRVTALLAHLSLSVGISQGKRSTSGPHAKNDRKRSPLLGDARCSQTAVSFLHSHDGPKNPSNRVLIAIGNVNCF